MKNSANEKVDFGFKHVNSQEKASMVADIFHSVADKYDIMNDLMSLGLHRLWKQSLIRALHPHPDLHLLDVAGGTGDIARGFLDAGGGKAILLDINQSMVEAGMERAINQGKLPFIDDGLPDYIIGDAQALPLKDNQFHLYTIGFGLRNVTHKQAALQEAYRVLKPGGRFFCLEFSTLSLPLLQKAYDLYSFNLLPKLGGWVTGDAPSYQYLVESIRRFPSQETLKSMIEQAGFHQATYHNLNFGVVAIHSGWKY